MKIAAGDRHRPRRPHLSCGDRGARAGHSRRRRRDECDGEAQDGHERHGLLRRGRHRSCLSRAIAFDVDTDARRANSSSRTPRSWSMSASLKWLSGCAMLPNDGVGLARMEFIISEHIGVHPMALVQPREDRRRQSASAIERLVAGYHKPVRFLRRTAGGRRRHDCRSILSQAGDRPPVRLQDQRIREPARRRRRSSRRKRTRCWDSAGASRYGHPAYAEDFALECAALRRVREDMGLPICSIMVPFCRSVEEGATRDRDDGGQRAQARRRWA